MSNTDWIDQRKKLHDAEALKSERDSNREELARRIITSGGIAFWNDLLDCLRATIPELRKLGLQGNMHDLHPVQGEGYEVAVHRQSACPVSTNVCIYFDGPGSEKIRCYPMHGEQYSLRFRVLADRQVGVYGIDGKPKSPEEAARHIIEPLTETLSQLEYRIG